MKRLQPLFLLVSLLMVAKPLYSQTVSDSLEFLALKALYDNTDGANWTNNTGWPTPGNWPTSATAAEMATWYGITAYNGDLTEISLANNNLSGNLPSQLGDLTLLKKLSLGNNQLTGSIPQAFDQLINMQFLYLNNNQLTGVFPQFLGSLTAIRNAHLDHNQLTGTLPSNLSNLSYLENLKVDDNKLTGEVTLAMVNHPNLNRLYLHRNNLTSIPDLSGHANQVNLDYQVKENNISFAQIEVNLNPDGTHNFSNFLYAPQGLNGDTTLVENVIGGTVTLSSTLLSTNNSYQWQKYNGSTWDDVSGATNADYVIANSDSTYEGTYQVVVTNSVVTGLTITSAPYIIQPTNGNVADQIEFEALKALYDSTNGAGWTDNTGWPTLGNWPATATAEEMGTWFGITATNGDITSVALANKLLTGTLPESIADLTELTTLDLGFNELSGSIPGVLGNLSKLTSLHLNNNQLTGEIPVELGNLTSLTDLKLSINQLSGSIPTELGNLTLLEELWLQTNQLSGEIPSSLGNLINLKRLFLSYNQLTGSIPGEFGNLSMLNYLYLSYNGLTGSIPQEFGSLGALHTLYLNNNQLSGSIPTELSNCSQLSSLILNDNQLSGEVPASIENLTKLISLRLQNNNLEGGILDYCVNMPQLKYLWVSNNSFSGEIPDWFGNLTDMESLYLDGNQFSGLIPSSFSDLSQLAMLFIQNNGFRGNVEKNMVNHPNMYRLNLSNNEFTSIPNLSDHTALDNFAYRVDGNLIPFSDIEANLNPDGSHNYLTFTYDTQGPTPMEYPTTAAIEGNLLTIDTHDASPNNSFVWEHETGGVWTDVTAQNENATGDKYVKTVTSDDAGKYRYTVTNSVLNTSKESGEIDIKTIHPKQLFLNTWAFQYKYDGRKRMVEKRVPGAGWVYMVYDNRDRLVLTQDSIQRENDEWLFTKYDGLNRPVATGIYTDATNTTLEDMQTYVNDNVGSTFDWYETEGADIQGYTNNSFPATSTEADYLTLTYYDDYDVTDTWDGGGYTYLDAGLSTVTNDTYTTPASENQNVKGQVTGSQVKNLGDNTWLKTVTYYDDKYRVIQVVADNHLGGLDRTSNLYDFVGKVLQTKTDHEVGTETNVTLQTNAYDHAGRLMEVKNKQDEEAEITMVSNTYNELGELIEKDLHSENGTDFIQSVDYAYNIRGWLTSINDADLPQEGQTNILNDDYFGMELLYNDEDGLLGNTGLYNGNISAVKWNSALVGSNKQAYTYAYDPMNRLTDANSKKKIGTWLGGSTDVNIGEYDLNGNIKLLTRQSANGPMDDLTYNYGTAGNQLQFVSDNEDKIEGFKDGNTTGNDYSYDGNGNMTEDKNKDIASIAYNYLNLPERVEKTDGQYITYIYDAAGIKLAQEVHDTNGDLIKRTDYSGAYVYEDGVLQFIQDQEGRIVMNSKDELVTTYEGENLTDVAPNQNADLSLTTQEDETYLKIVSNQSTSTPGVLVGEEIAVVPGERYLYRMKGYTVSSVPVRVTLLDLDGWTFLSWTDFILSEGVSNEDWVSKEIVIPEGVTRIQLSAAFWVPTAGDEFYINKIEFTKLVDGYTPEYQYYLKDHLGNTRITFTAKDNVDNYPVTMESENYNAETEYSDFPFETLDVYSAANHTPGGNEAQRLDHNYPVGASIMLPVEPGDKVDLEVWAYFEGSSGYNAPAASGILSSIASVFGGTSGAGGEAGAIYNGLETILVAEGLAGSNEADRPAAYLNYIFLSEDYSFNAGNPYGFEQIPTEAMNSLTQMDVSGIEINERGYVFVYLSYEGETTDKWVMFDDLKVTHTKNRIIQMEDYYPFGLTFNSYQRPNTTEQNYQYNGKELQDELDVNWLDYGARMYMADIGRWGVVDPLANKFNNWSPYNYVMDNPVLMVDPDGSAPDLPPWARKLLSFFGIALPGATPADPQEARKSNDLNNAYSRGATAIHKLRDAQREVTGFLPGGGVFNAIIDKHTNAKSDSRIAADIALEAGVNIVLPIVAGAGKKVVKELVEGAAETNISKKVVSKVVGSADEALEKFNNIIGDATTKTTTNKAGQEITTATLEDGTNVTLRNFSSSEKNANAVIELSNKSLQKDGAKPVEIKFFDEVKTKNN